MKFMMVTYKYIYGRIFKKKLETIPINIFISALKQLVS